MSTNTTVVLSDDFVEFIQSKIAAGRFESTSEAIRAGLRLLEEHEAKLDVVRQKLEVAELQLEAGDSADGDLFLAQLLA